MLFDILIRRARVFDGAGNPWITADIGVTGDTIEAVGDLRTASAREEIDACALTAAPGFIDIHTHSDMPLLIEGAAHSHVRQGVTTNVIGNCGTSLAPVTDRSVEYLRARAEEAGVDFEWRSMAEYLDCLEESRVSVNVLPLVGQGTLRGSVMGFVDREPDDEELDQMRCLTRQAMEDGAFGLSTGLIYVPGSYAHTDELVSLSDVVSEYGGLYATHIRGENDTLLDAFREALEIGRLANVPVQVSHVKAMGRHMWGASSDLLELLDNARQQGVDVTGDQYPYNASATGLGAYLPPWAHVGGAEKLRTRLGDPEMRAKIRRDMLEGTQGWVSLHRGVGWENTLITRCCQEDLEGRSVSDIAVDREQDPFDTAFDILAECEGRVGVVYFTIGDEDLERIMSHPAIMIGSDSSAVSAEGPLARGKPHPRAFGTFSRVLGLYAREKGTVGLADAIRKMTSMPAHRMGLHDRGLLRPGMKADVVLFDAEVVADQATYTEPFCYPTGMHRVFVNGQETVRDGEHLGVHAGRVLRRR